VRTLRHGRRRRLVSTCVRTWVHGRWARLVATCVGTWVHGRLARLVATQRRSGCRSCVMSRPSPAVRTSWMSSSSARTTASTRSPGNLGSRTGGPSATSRVDVVCGKLIFWRMKIFGIGFPRRIVSIRKLLALSVHTGRRWIRASGEFPPHLYIVVSTGRGPSGPKSVRWNAPEGDGVTYNTPGVREHAWTS